jgi:hypothetical protein
VSSPIFLLSSGRSGSTLLQRVLNSYDDVIIWGEHRGILAPMADAYFQLLEHPWNKTFMPSLSRSEMPPWSEVLEWKDGTQWQAWLNWVSPADIDRCFRGFVESMFHHPDQPATMTWGFKEIRYGGHDRVIEFLSRLFPEATFVFLARNGLNTVESQLRTFNGVGSNLRSLRGLGRLKLIAQRSREWRLQNAALLQWHRSGRLRSHWVSFEQIAAADRVALRSFLTAIGRSFGPAQERVCDEQEGRGTSESEATLHDRWRSFGFAPLLVVEWMLGRMNAELGYATPPPVQWLHRLRRAGL